MVTLIYISINNVLELHCSASSAMLLLPMSKPFFNMMSVKWHFTLIYIFLITSEAEHHVDLLVISMFSSWRHLTLCPFFIGSSFRFVEILIFESFSRRLQISFP